MNTKITKSNKNVEIKLQLDIVEQIYEQTIIRAFENHQDPIKQLIFDSVDILLWLDICVNVNDLKIRLMYLKHVETLLNNVKNQK